MRDPKQRFTEIAEDYERFRPSYPDSFLDWLWEDARLSRGARVADVGCGTGVSTRQLATRGLDVVGVEPNQAMRSVAERLGGARYAAGSAEATGLESGAFSLVCAAQAFHWFDAPRALAEFSRLARRDGRGAAFWNVRADTPFLRDYEALLRRRSTDYDCVPKPRETIEGVASLVQDVHRAEFPNLQKLGLQGLLGRARSASYVALGVADRGAFEAELCELFDRHEKAGVIDFAYQTTVITWKP